MPAGVESRLGVAAKRKMTQTELLGWIPQAIEEKGAIFFLGHVRLLNLLLYVGCGVQVASSRDTYLIAECQDLDPALLLKKNLKYIGTDLDSTSPDPNRFDWNKKRNPWYGDPNSCVLVFLIVHRADGNRSAKAVVGETLLSRLDC
jgi:hypothetical protein